MSRLGRVIVTLLLVAATSACAMSLRNPHVADLQRNPGRYQHQTVSIEGVVTSSWGVPAPYKFYRVDDGTGQVTVLSQDLRLPPPSGSRVRVKGRVDELAVLEGQALGLHLREESLYVKR